MSEPPVGWALHHASPARAAIARAAARFAFSDTARLDAELLLAHALGMTREALLLSLDTAAVPAAFAELVARRAAHEPIAYLTGSRAFWTIDLAVAPGVLIPRPDSETLLEAAVAHFAGTAGPARVLDLGTGSGALLLAALDQWPAATAVGVDASAKAVAIAQANAARLGMDARAQIVRGGWSGTGEAFDLVLCNPPYIRRDATLPLEVRVHEPASALFAGDNGLDAYRALAPQLPAQVAAGGAACIEIGHDQAVEVGALLRSAGCEVALRRDLGGRDRCLVATRETLI